MRVLIAVLTLCLFAVSVHAQYSGGSGTADDPYQIATAADLIALGEMPDDYDKHFILTADIDLDPNLPGGRVFDRAVIAPAGFSPFTGRFDGNGHTVSHLTITGTGCLGLFGGLQSGATISNLDLKAVDVNGTGDYVGGLVGQTSREGRSTFGVKRIENCSSNGMVKGKRDVGGLMGSNDLLGNITNCHSTGAVSGYESNAGGLVGFNLGSITTSHSACTVTGSWRTGGLVGYNGGNVAVSYSNGETSGGNTTGGLVGENGGGIWHSYSVGSVTGTSTVGGLLGENGGRVVNSYSVCSAYGQSDAVGGLIGLNGSPNGMMPPDFGRIINCYSAGFVHGTDSVGGLVGHNLYGEAVNSFWDIESTGQISSALGTGKTAAEMQNIDTYLYTGWDFENENLNGISDYWKISQGNYPSLCYPVMPEGLGTAEEPYLIRDVRELGTVWYKPMAHYRLEASIDLSDVPWFMAVIPWFGGTFNGNTYVISNLCIQGKDYLGLFGQLELGAKISNLGMEAVDVNGTSEYVGSLVGYNNGSIAESYSTGTVSGYDNAGGLVGFNDGSIIASYSTATVGGTWSVGGLVGFNYSDITKSYSTGTVSGDSRVGGLVGTNGYYQPTAPAPPDQGVITSCYSTGTVAGNNWTGGLVGSNSLNARVISSFWDVETSDLLGSDGGVGLTTAEMMDPEMIGLSGLANDPNWVLDAGKDYPRLAWEGTAGAPIPDPLIDWMDGDGSLETPYQIVHVDQLVQVSKANVLADKHFIIMNDIDLAGLSWFQAVIPHFSGTFNGNGFRIQHLSIKGGSHLGFIGILQEGSVDNLGLENISVEGTGDYVGGLMGYNQGHVSACYSTGTVNGDGWVGGLIGGNGRSITASYSTATVSGNEYVGGLVGRSGGSIATCYSTGKVVGDTQVGGLVGCDLDRLGHGGGRHVIQSFWDVQTSGLDTSDGGTGLTTSEMQTAATFLDAGWDFVDETENGTDDIWWILEGQDYPRLWWELEENETGR